MSGLAASFFVSASRAEAGAAPAEWFDGTNLDLQRYADDDVTIVVGGRFPGSSIAGSYAEIVETERYVMALEGYVLNLPELVDVEASSPPEARGRLLLDSFASDGQRTLQSLEGAYTLVVWDKAERVASIATCRFGQRNLYARAAGGGLSVATDLRALKALTGAAYALDPAVMWMCFLYGGVYGRDTPIRHVSKVLPGSVLTVRRGSVSETLARDLGHATTSPVEGRREALDRLDAAMRRAVGRLGQVGQSHALMIGSGVDSSLVAAYAREEIANLIAVTQRMPGAFDESAQATRIAAALGIPHHTVPYEVGRRPLLDDVARFVRIAEEPAYWNQLGSPLLSLLESLPRRPQAFLTGAEGDFLFNFRTGRVSIARVIGYGLFRPVAGYVARRLVNRVTHHTYIVGSDFDLLDRPFMRQHMAADPPVSGNTYYSHEYAHLPAGANSQRHFLDNGWQNVRIISRFASAFGVEALFPYMDDAVVAAVLSLPQELKINKMLLRLLLRRHLATAVVPTRKTGYWANTIKWHYERGALQDVLDLMAEPRTLERGLYDRAAVGTLVHTYTSRAAGPTHHPILWQLLLVEMFCREFVDGL